MSAVPDVSPHESGPVTVLPQATVPLCNGIGKDTANSVLSAEWCDTNSAEKHVAAWEALAGDPLERNVFYEPWMLLPAMRLLAGDVNIRLLLVFRGEKNKELVALFPLQYHHVKFLPARVVSLWRHPHCFLCTPLLKREYAQESLNFALDLLFEGKHPLLAFRTVSGDGPFHTLLLNEISRRQLLSISEIHSRPVVRISPEDDGSLLHQMSGHRRGVVLRRERKLARAGELKYETTTVDVETWITSFLRIEASGWKGEAGSAMDVNPGTREFFRAIVTAAHKRGALIPASLLLNGRLLAQRVSFLSGDEAFSFKTAYDENYSTYSPGVLLELATLRDVHTRPDLRMMDSCTAAPERAPMNGMWKAQRAIHTVFMMRDTATGRLLRAVLPRARAIQQRVSQY